MQKYTYKDSGFKWLGEIPEHWIICKTKNIGVFETSSVDKKFDEKFPLVNLINYMDVYDSQTKFINDTKKLMKMSATHTQIKVSQVQNGDVLFTPSSETADDIGHSVVIDGNFPSTLFSYHIVRLSFNKKYKVDNKFKRFIFNNHIVLNHLSSLSKGITRMTLKQRDFREIYFPLPPVREQKGIAEYLEKATTKIDCIINIKQEQLEKMEFYYDSKIHEYITKGIKKNSLIESGVIWQGKVPEHWKRDKLFRLADKMGSGGTPKSTNQDNYGGDISWIQSGDLNDWIISTTKKTITEEALNNSSAKMFKKGTLLIAMYGATIGKLGIMGMDSSTNQACCAIQVGSKLNSNFLFYLLYDMRKFLISQGYGGGQQNISQETLKQQYFYYPEKNEQIEIVNKIKDFRSKQEVIRDNVKSQIETLQIYRKSLIHECVTGKKQVTNAIKEKANA